MVVLSVPALISKTALLVLFVGWIWICSVAHRKGALAVLLFRLFVMPCYAGQHCEAPSTRMTWPLMKRAASEARKATTEATSGGRP